ncbi:hypothetical protein BBJ28_00005221 [Nothophytophthora sp. Chile5]|nr:hypothetical protein BBJ28_00005221 [Nothophytophthora sp. Chile5]
MAEVQHVDDQDEEKRLPLGDVIEIDDDDDGDDEEEDVEETEADAVSLLPVRWGGFLPSCDHRFHFDCIVAWAKVTNLCPLCKTKFNVVTRMDAEGVVVHREAIQDHKQVFRPDPADHDIAAQLRLVNEARCELCGSGEDEHVLLMCEAPGCGVANHTYCIGFSTVPNTSWYCSRHSTMPQRASDVIARPATTVSTRRRTRRLASLMSNVLGGRGSATARPRRRGQPRAGAAATSEERRPMRGIAAAYALRMSRELQQVQSRADAMFARGDLTRPGLYEPRTTTAADVARYGTRSTVVPSTLEQMWQDQSRSRQELAAAALEAGRTHDGTSSGGSSRSSHSNKRISKTFAPEYRELAKLMLDAVSHDNYASSVSLSIPKTAKLRLVSRVKTFFGRLNGKEKVAALKMGCLSVLHQWDGLRATMDSLSNLADVSIEMRERAIELSERWRELNPPPPRQVPRSQVDQELAPREEIAQHLPVITAFTSPKRPARSNAKRKRKHEAWSETVVKYVKAKLYPLYKQSNGVGLTRERFKVIVKQVVELFSEEAASMQSAVLLPSGELSDLVKTRLKKLIDRVYKGTSTGALISSSTAPAPTLIGAVVPAATYSAVPSIKHQRTS